MAIVKLVNTLKTNLFIESIARNVAPGAQITLPDSVVESDPDIARCVGSGMLKRTDHPQPESQPVPEPVGDQSSTETRQMERVTPEGDYEVELESEGDAVVVTGDMQTAKAKPMNTNDIPLPDWLNQDQLRRSEAAARAYDAQEGLVEEWRVTDEGIEKTHGGRTDMISEDGVTVRKASDPADELPEPVKVGRVKRTDDGENNPMVDEDADDGYSNAFVDDKGDAPDAGYGDAFIDSQ